jgi:hypothetical protein
MPWMLAEQLLSRCREMRRGGMARSDLLAFAERELCRRGLTEPDLDVATRVLTLKTLARPINDLEAIARAPVRH